MKDKFPMFGRLRTQSLHQRQKGVALITALIITSVAVSFATLIIYRQQIQIRLSSNISILEQNYQYAYGMESFAGTILRQSWEDQPDFVSLNDDWYAESGLVLPITGGVMTGKLYDLQARININSLNRPKEPIPPANPDKSPPDPIEYIDKAGVTEDRLTRLIFNIDEQQEMGPHKDFAIIIKDWIDSDSNNGYSLDSDEQINSGSGAETTYYQSIEPAYFSANTEMISPTELRLLKNMKEKFYKGITAEIATLPIESGDEQTNTAINVNTASARVLQSLGFDISAVEEITTIREEQPYESLDDFKSSLAVEGSLIPNGVVNPLDIDVKSQYFLLEGKVEINSTRLFINSVLWRNKNGVVSVIMRDFSNPQTISKAVN